jgi:hypothetical protein
MITALFSGDRPLWFTPLLDEIRTRHLEQGGDPADFPDYLEEQGIKMIPGTFLTEVSDTLVTYAHLKFI